jgi:hypothetical protein
MLSEWTIRALSDDPSVFRAWLHTQAAKDLGLQFTAWIEKRFGVDAGDGAKVDALAFPAALIPPQPTIQHSRTLMRAVDDNVPFASAEELVETARTKLSTKYAGRAGRLSLQERAAINAVRAMRNAISHASPKSLRTLNATLRSAALPATLRYVSARNVQRRGIGRYLCQRIPAAPDCRLVEYLNVLAGVAYVLAPTRGRRTQVCP